MIRLKDKAGSMLMTDKDNANLLNQYFASVFTNEEDKTELIFNSSQEEAAEPFEFTVENLEEAMADIEITEEDVYDVLKGLDPYKSFSEECIHPLVLKELAEELKQPIALLFRCSLYQGNVPEDWKKSTVTPSTRVKIDIIPKTIDRYL